MREHAELDVDELMREIRYELAGTGRADGAPVVDFRSGPASSRHAGDAPTFSLHRLSESSGVISRRSQYDLDALLAYHDEDFVRNAYLALLGREPDTEGASRYLAKLRTGELAKVEVLGRIRFSPEGRAAGVNVAGLVVPFGLRTVRRIPVIGYAAGIVQYVLRLPTIVRNLERLEAVVFLHRLELRRDVNDIEKEIEAALHGTHADLSSRIEIAGDRLSSIAAQSERSEDRLGERMESLASHMAARVTRADLDNRVQSERNAQDEQWSLRLAAIDREKADRATLDELVVRQEAVSQAQHELGAILGNLRDLGAAAQVSIAALEQGKSDREQVNVSMDRVAAEILELRSLAKDGVADVRYVRSVIDDVRATIGHVEGRLAGQASAVARAESVALAESATNAARLAAVGEQLARYQQEVIGQERRLSTLLDEVRRSLPEQALGPDQLATFAHEQQHMLDGFYLEFEDRFRGTREDIAQRVAIYLPYIRNANAGSPGAPVLDIGCGRGEWLELLAAQGLVGHGVDSNRSVAAFCRQRGISVVEADALEHLRSLPTGSLGAITAIHVIEHMPFAQVLALFDEARRVLRTGGVAIFETPNPENVVVGACNFYYDPTHVRPLPPEPLRFVLSQRGFADVELVRLHPRHDAPPSDDNPRPLDAEVAQRFYGAQDYAVVGFKRTPA